MAVDSEAIKPHVAVLPSPGMGHLIPVLEFAKHLVNHHNLHVSFLVITTAASAAQHRLLNASALPDDLHIINLPPADVSSVVTDDMPILTRITYICKKSLKLLRSILNEINLPKTLIVDNFIPDEAFHICKELDIPVYTFYTCATKNLALAFYLPKLDKEVKCEFVDLPDPVQVPGCRAIYPDDFSDSLKNRKIEEYKWNLCNAIRLPMATGIFVNTWDDFESKSSWLNGIKSDPYYQSLPAPPIYPVGPLIKHEEPVAESENYIMSWLDTQPSDSVLFIALGSGGTLTSEQLTELACGLEMSKQRFIFMVRKPSDASAASTFFSAGNNADDPATYLPEGFLERTKEVGLVVASWAPQVPVLRHEATGGFLSHCGWNSTLESMVHGVPMIAWPLYAEQRINATLLTEEVGVAVKPVGEVVDGGRKVVKREEVERVVRLVMEGEEGKVMKEKTRELKQSAAKALECGGSSYDLVSCVVESWK